MIMTGLIFSKTEKSKAGHNVKMQFRIYQGGPKKSTVTAFLVSGVKNYF